MQINTNYVSNYNSTIKVNNNQKTISPNLKAQGDTVTFKANINRQNLILRFSMAAMGGLAAAVEFLEKLSSQERDIVMEEINKQADIKQTDEVKSADDVVDDKLSLEEKAASDFKELAPYRWVAKYKGDKENFEQLLLDDDTCENQFGKRLYFVPQSDVLGVFRKDKEALERIYTRENILNIEKFGGGRNSAIEDLAGYNGNTEFLDQLMSEKDSDGKTLLHIFAGNSVKEVEHANYAYRKRLDKLADMYLTKDTNNKYPLEYIKDKSKEDQQEILQSVKDSFDDEPEMLIKILSSSGFEKEADMVKKIQDIRKNGYEYIEKDTGNRVVEHIYSSWQIEDLLNGKEKGTGLADKYEKYSPNGLLIEQQEGDSRSSWKTFYKYDNNGRIIEKTTDAAHGTQTIRFEYDENGEQKVIQDDAQTGWSQW